MPVHKVKGGYKWGKTGKTYPTKKQAERQARAIYANGYKGINEEDDNETIEILKNMTEKNIIRLTESQLKRVISESIKKMLNEIGDTNRGQYMLGRLHRRHNTDADLLSGVDSQARKFNKGNWEVFDQGYNDEGISNALDKSNTIRRNYGVYKMNDMDKVGRKFIEFIEKNDLALQLIVDYMSGNQNGTKYSSPLPELIPQFEDDVLGYECSNEMKKAIEKAFNEWWYYAESQLMPEEMNESKKKNVKFTESQLREMISESVERVLKSTFLNEGKYSVWDKWWSENYWEQPNFLKELRPSDILNGDVDEFIRDRQFWNDIELDYDYLLPALDTRMAMLDKKWAWDKIENEDKGFRQSLAQKYEKTLNNNKESQISSAWDEHEKETFPKKKGFFGHFTYADTDDIIKAFDNQ